MTVRLLDGGMRQEAPHPPPPPGDAEAHPWLMLREPDLMQCVHQEFLRAGADIITTNTFVTNRWRMVRHGESAHYAQANHAACEAAHIAREAENPAALIAGSLPPLRGAFEPDLVPPDPICEAEYAEHAIMLAQNVDFFLAETLSTSREAIAAAKAAAACGRSIWIAFTIEDVGAPHLRGGESIEDAVNALRGLAVDAFLVNCAVPEAISRAMPELRAAAGSTPFGGYANGYRLGFMPGAPSVGLNEPDKRILVEPETYAKYAAHWISEGATIVGGCCNVGPDHIARLKELIGP